MPNQWNSYLELVELAKDQGDFTKQERYATLLGENVLAALSRADVVPSLKGTGCEVAGAAIYFVPTEGANAKERALRWIEQSIEFAPTANRYFKLGLAWKSQDTTNETTAQNAHNAFGTALTLDPGHQGAIHHSSV